MNSSGHKHDIRSSRTRSCPSSRDKVRDVEPRDPDDDADVLLSNTCPAMDNTPLAMRKQVRPARSMLCWAHVPFWARRAMAPYVGGIIPDLDHHAKPQVLHEAVVRELKGLGPYASAPIPPIEHEGMPGSTRK